MKFEINYHAVKNAKSSAVRDETHLGGQSLPILDSKAIQSFPSFF